MPISKDVLTLLSKIGNTVYIKSRGKIVPFKLLSVTILEHDVSFYIRYAGDNELLKSWNCHYSIKDIGYSVFYTEEEVQEL